MSEQHDREFIKRFSLTLVALMVFTVVIIFVARGIHGTMERSESQARTVAKQERILPVAGVYAGDTGRAAAQAAAEAARAAAPAVAFEGSLDGQMIYDRVCGTCHNAGAAGAPQLIAAAWDGRLDKGRDQLVANAINGINAMPARGGRMDLSDEQVAASVDYMLGALE
ncbi:c-type cytochrome [Wenzhouxiangella marina]|uniref:Transmembrane-anchored cytochrome c n=1 Tax=Wenzhouxiangella marina TaxID=1579979 RepID=A0A0K0XYX4_9GAMM|nr:c-type cytochrome [Wenzhouxiangella marina]AKS42889.1 Transmembrane-anchored cytochrome c [Wenzhouxiangella marina]MBB6087428.1 cytochrome c5 [Wenzhouxiangella marina]